MCLSAFVSSFVSWLTREPALKLRPSSQKAASAASQTETPSPIQLPQWEITDVQAHCAKEVQHSRLASKVISFQADHCRQTCTDKQRNEHYTHLHTENGN